MNVPTDGSRYTFGHCYGAATTNASERDFRAPHKQINKAYWEMSFFPSVARPFQLASRTTSTTFPDKHYGPVGAVPAGCVGASHFIKRTVQLFQKSRC